jgi:hypothetical protein
MKKVLLATAAFLFLLSAQAQKSKKKDKDLSEKEKRERTDYQQSDPVADTATKFIGVIKYHMTTDDPSVKDSMIIVFGEDKIKITMFYPGYKENDVFKDIMIANFKDSTFLVLDDRKKTYKTEKLGARNAGTEISLANYRKTGMVMKMPCKEFSGEIIMPDGETFETAVFINNQYSYVTVQDYNFMNIHPVVMGYKIVLGYRNKTTDNENTYFLAYEIKPGDPAAHFDMAEYKAL